MKTVAISLIEKKPNRDGVTYDHLKSLEVYFVKKEVSTMLLKEVIIQKEIPVLLQNQNQQSTTLLDCTLILNTIKPENQILKQKIMNSISNTPNEYKHFLSYNQLSVEGVEFGTTDLFFCIKEDTLLIKSMYHYTKSEHNLEVPIENRTLSETEILQNFLLNFMSYPVNFMGYPVYEKSDVFTNEAFDEMLQEGIKKIDERRQISRLIYEDNELLKYCQSINLYPRPTGGNPTDWVANCPSGRNHQIEISTYSNQWGCGYCCKKGNITDLREWWETKMKNM